MEKHKQKMKTSDVLRLTAHSLHLQEPCTEKTLVETFLQRLLMMDYRARYITTKEETTDLDHNYMGTEDEDRGFDGFFSKEAVSFHRGSCNSHIHPMDVQMAVFHCSDNFLKQLIVTKLSQCQYALPLLVPDPFTKEIEFPLWTFRQISKTWKITDTSGKEISKTQPVYETDTPMVAFFRFGSVSSSKSQLMNSLINEKHATFFHRHCPGSSRNRLLMDGVVEIAWYCPSGMETDYFSDFVAFCNLHGDAETHKEQLDLLIEKSSVNVVLLSNPEIVTKNEILKNLFMSSKPLICLFYEDKSSVTKNKNGKYRIGLKDRNQSDVTKNLRATIKDCLLKSPSGFRLNDLCKEIKTDEDDPACERGKEGALKMMRQLEKKEISQLKKEHLPCQGQLWHDWCEMNKDLHRLQGIDLEEKKSTKQREMKQIREQQHNHGLSCTMNLFISSLNSLTGNDKLYFLKWVGILLDKFTSDDLSALHYTYSEKWTKVLDLKKNHDRSEKMKAEQAEISQNLNAATFGLEHFLREMGQIYESFISVQKQNKGSSKENVSSLPKLAAELIISGFPIELMDGDAAHVPLIWVSAVLDELIKILGDQRIFVLSVLEIQSSGKSTMLNAMFGLQFAVSAGRCTRGAFMQLVRVSEEMKFDYILIVDTEGLRALELAGKSTRHHDNELATFVVGLGNMTLINIFGENPAEMQDILQIVVQAFLRMKKVRLNPGCMFVHQNVGDITAGEKNMEGRRRLQENLDEMTKLAAKEEDSDAELFSHVISFNVQTDVQYFAQLWEGSPPMAPPNPSYSENILKLKNTIFQKASTSNGMTLSQFKTCLSDLWESLFNENFVFSFKNTLEIAVYRKLETEFGNWTWTLRSAMLDIEEKLHNRIENKKMKKIEEKDLYAEMKTTKLEVEQSMKQYFEENRDKDILIQWRGRFQTKIKQLHEDLVHDAKKKLNEVIQQQNTQESFEHKKTQYDEMLFGLSKDLTLKLNHKETDKKMWKQEFDKVWDEWVMDLIQHHPSEKTFDFWEDVLRILSVGYEEALVCDQNFQEYYKTIDQSGTYSHYMVLKKQEEHLDEVQSTEKSDLKKKEAKGKIEERPVAKVFNRLSNWLPVLNLAQVEQPENHLNYLQDGFVRDLTRNVIQETEELIKSICNKIAKLGYKKSYIQELTDYITDKVEQHQRENQKIKLKKEFTVDLCLHVCDLANTKFTKIHKQYVDANSVQVYLEKQKPQYYSVFLNYCRGTSATAIFGDLICSNLKPSIQQAAYNKTATDLSAQIRSDMPEFNGNRSQLEKHILKCLAEEENFEKYKIYIHYPKKHFEQFITEKVIKYISEKCTTVLKMFKENLEYKQQRVVNALNITTEEVKNRGGDADMWLKTFSNSLKDELNFNELAYVYLKEITDFDFLKQIICHGLTDMMSELYKRLNSVTDINMKAFRNKPDEILIEHLCRCCWVQCPFCNAICTNTMEDHDGDHSVPFHRVEGISGMIYKGTTQLSSDFCTTLVQSDKSFYPNETDVSVPYKIYRTAGGEFAKWSITPDNSELPYWKWFVCRFQKDLEKYYGKQFQGSDEIPTEWRDFTKEQAIESLDKYI